MKTIKQSVFILILTLIFTSCSSVFDNNALTFSDENLSVSINISDFDNKAFNILLTNKGDNEILLIITEAKVLTVDGEYVNIMRQIDATSDNNVVNVKNMRINPGIVLDEEFVAVGYTRKQIIKDEYVLLPWIDDKAFDLSIPYIVKNRKKLIEINL